MKSVTGLASILALLSTAACNHIMVDPGPTQTAHEEIEAGKVEAVRADITMGAGELRLEGGGAKLLDATFRYSEKLGRPVVKYDATGFRGRLTVEGSKKSSSAGDITNEWNLRMGTKMPLDLYVKLGAGKSQLDVSTLPVHSLEVNIGAGELELNMLGKYEKDVAVQIHGGVGSVRVKLPSTFGVVVDAKGGIGSLDAKGLKQRDGRYYNNAYAEGKPAIRMEVRGGIGEIRLSVEE